MARYRFAFWLDCRKDDELLLAEEIDTLKRGRAFTATIRDGLRLMLDLRAGKLEVLCELFPWVAARLSAEQGGASRDLQAKLDQLEKLLLAQGMPPVAGQGGPKPLQVRPASAPVFEDDDDDADLLVVREARSDGLAIAHNFLRSAFALQGEVYKH